MPSDPPITEFDLHAWLDDQLDPARKDQVSRYLDAHPDAAARVAAWRAQKEGIRAMVERADVQALPARLAAAARGYAANACDAPSARDADRGNVPRGARTRTAWPTLRTRWNTRSLAAGCALVLVGVATGWTLRTHLVPIQTLVVASAATPVDAPASAAFTTRAAVAAGFAQRAAMAHAVYAPEARRPVEVDAAHEAQLVAWLSHRMGSPMRPARLQSLGYALEGGRLLPGRKGPVAQFMYRDAHGQRLTLYVSNKMSLELADDIQHMEQRTAPGRAPVHATLESTRPDGAPPDMSFHFLEHEGMNVFYWIDGAFGYALSATMDRAHLAQLSTLVYRQLAGNKP